MRELPGTIYELLKRAEEAYGPSDAVRYKVKGAGEGGKREVGIAAKTYTQLKKDSEHFTAALSGLGQQGKHIAILGAASYSWITAYYGIVNGGSVAVPLDGGLPAPELCQLIRRADVTALVFDGTKAEAAQMALEQCPKLAHLIAMEDKGSVPGALSMWELAASAASREAGGAGSGTGREDSSRPEQEAGVAGSGAGQEDSSRPEQEAGVAGSGAGQEDSGRPRGGYEPKPEDLATIMFTSGTTGKSKGVMLTHRNLAENATALDMGYEPGTVILSVLPIHHAYCLSMDILKGMSVGAVICINDSLLRVARNIKLFEPNMILMVPLMVETLAKKLEDASLVPAPIIKARVFGKQFHTICSGGAYLDPAYIDLFKRYGITILQGYGMTECAPVISTNSKYAAKAGSIGKPLPNCRVKIVDEEIWVKGSSVMQGYYRMPEETAEALQEGWLKTGDLGYMDEEGYLFLTGRKKNLIITPNGENVSPEEIENRLGRERLIQEVLVREHNGVIQAEIFPDLEYAAKKRIKDLPGALQKIIDGYNGQAPLYKRIFSLKVRDREFEKNTTRKIKRF